MQEGGERKVGFPVPHFRLSTRLEEKFQMGCRSDISGEEEREDGAVDEIPKRPFRLNTELWALWQRVFASFSIFFAIFMPYHSIQALNL